MFEAATSKLPLWFPDCTPEGNDRGDHERSPLLCLGHGRIWRLMGRYKRYSLRGT